METEILKYILDNRGAVISSDLLFNLGNTSAFSEIICNNDKFVTCLFNGTPKVVVRSPVKLCWRKDCPGCGGLHLCKSFLLTESCQFTYTRRGCIFSHDLHSGHNKTILTKFGLETLSRAQLCLLLLQSNNNLLPPICHNYNNRNGCEDTSCTRLHICEKFLNSDCSCFRTHDFMAPQPLKLLQDKRIPASVLESLKSVYANKQALWLAEKLNSRRNVSSDPRAASSLDLTHDSDNSQDSHNSGYHTDSNTGTNPNSNRGGGSQGRGGHFRGGRDNRKRQGQRDKTEICMYFIKGRCKYEDHCFKAHVKMPYMWEINVNGKWTPMADNEKIEQAYCDPKNTYSTTNPLVYFDIMKSGENEVRRLSTINSVLEPDFIHTTDWLWYWEDDNGKWVQYGANASVHQPASVTSKYLEEMYLENGKAVIQFKAGSQSYDLSFQDMIQTNIKYLTKRVVRRRPQFVSAAEVPTKRKRIANTTAAVPDYWDKTQISPTEHRRICLQPSLAEYKEIHELFCQTMKGFDILKIERIQNKAIWEAFQLHKNHMKNKNNGQLVAEKKLFHGTDPSHVETICATNFDWRLCGVNGTLYGQGSYFARDAKYSHSYTGTSQDRFMFVSRVLVGQYTRGRSEYRRPPSKDGSDVNLYDSCVDDVMNPSIFVVFEKQQIYPEYILQYRERDQQHTYSQLATTPIVPPTPAVTVSVPSASSTVSLNPLATNLTTTFSPASTKASLTNPAITPSIMSSKALVTNMATTPVTRPSATSATSATRPSNPGSTFSSRSPNPFQTSLTAASTLTSAPSTVAQNPFGTNLTTTSSPASTKASVTNPAITPSTMSSKALATNMATTPVTRPSVTSATRPYNPASTFSPRSPNPLQTSPTAASTIRSADYFAPTPQTFTSDTSFRFAATSLRVTTHPTSSTAAFQRSSSKQEKKCIIA